VSIVLCYAAVSAVECTPCNGNSVLQLMQAYVQQQLTCTNASIQSTMTMYHQCRWTVVRHICHCCYKDNKLLTNK
jgi:hypothetical protein